MDVWWDFRLCVHSLRGLHGGTTYTTTVIVATAAAAAAAATVMAMAAVAANIHNSNIWYELMVKILSKWIKKERIYSSFHPFIHTHMYTHTQASTQACERVLAHRWGDVHIEIASMKTEIAVMGKTAKHSTTHATIYRTKLKQWEAYAIFVGRTDSYKHNSMCISCGLKIHLHWLDLYRLIMENRMTMHTHTIQRHAQWHSHMRLTSESEFLIHVHFLVQHPQWAKARCPTDLHASNVLCTFSILSCSLALDSNIPLSPSLFPFIGIYSMNIVSHPPNLSIRIACVRAGILTHVCIINFEHCTIMVNYFSLWNWLFNSVSSI